MPKDFDPKLPKRKAPYPDRKPSKPKSSTQQDRGEDKQYPSVNELKRRIRDVRRLLSKTDLPADKRIIQERALAGYEKELADEEQRRERSRMIKKYHFVRFLDRKTATKKVNKLNRTRDELANTKTTDGGIDEETKKKLEKLDARLRIARVNLNYTIYYPLMKKYISIYAERKKAGDDQNQDGEEGSEEDGGELELSASATEEKKAMWLVVEKCMEDGTLDLLREGKLDLSGGEGAGEKSEASKSRSKKDSGTKKAGRKEKTNVKTSRSEDRKGKSTKHAPPVSAEEAEGDESDGGFFEM
ncbi:hypothetical protein BDW62DRAFT_220390 [Aspergillus aurantiobrunneus]